MEAMKALYEKAFKNARAKIDAILEASGKKFKRYDVISEDIEGGNRIFDRAGLAANIAPDNAEKSPKMEISLVPLEVKLTSRLKVIAVFE